MNIFAKESIIIKNNDGTYRLEFLNVELADEESNKIKGTIIFPRTISTNLIDELGNIDTSKLLCDFETDGDTIFTLDITEDEINELFK